LLWCVVEHLSIIKNTKLTSWVNFVRTVKVNINSLALPTSLTMIAPTLRTSALTNWRSNHTNSNCDTLVLVKLKYIACWFIFIIQLTFIFVLLQLYLREGCLQKFSRKGLQQRMFFLVSFWQWFDYSSNLIYFLYSIVSQWCHIFYLTDLNLSFTY